MTLSTEAVIAIIGVIVTLPPAVAFMVRASQKHRAFRKASRRSLLSSNTEARIAEQELELRNGQSMGGSGPTAATLVWLSDTRPNYTEEMQSAEMVEQRLSLTWYWSRRPELKQHPELSAQP